jgi:hypothetical protein
LNVCFPSRDGQQWVDTGNAVLLTADGHAHRSSCERRTCQVQA